MRLARWTAKGTLWLLSWPRGYLQGWLDNVFRLGIMCNNKEGWKFLPLQGRKSSQTKMMFWKLHWGKLFLLIFTGPRPIQDGSWDAFLLKVWSWQGFAGHCFLFGLLSRLGRRDSLVFSPSLPPPFIRTYLLPGQGERLGWCSPLTLLLRTSGCCLGAQERGWREWAQKKRKEKKTE